MRAARRERGLSQAELAAAAGLTRQAIYEIEAGRYLPNVAIALRLARALDRPVEGLFELDGGGSVLEGELLGCTSGRPPSPRAKVWCVGDRTFVLPLTSLGSDLASRPRPMA